MKEYLCKVEENIYYIDPLRLGQHSVSGVYLIIADGISLVEIGTSVNVPFVLEAVRELGLQESDIRRAIVTHIHLDHSGGAGTLIRRLPHVRMYVHERGMRHLIDPSKLLRSAQMVYGDSETITAIHGQVLPAPPENLIAVAGKETAGTTEIEIGGNRCLKILDAPGHAPHHLCVFDERTGCLFSGEALGHYHPDSNILLPAVAPPGFDFQASVSTIRRIAPLKPRLICFSQFGQHRDASFVLEESQRLLKLYSQLIQDALKAGFDTGQIIEMMFEKVSVEPHAAKFSQASIRGMLMSIVLGYYQYFQRIRVTG